MVGGCSAVSDGRHGGDGSGLESGQRTDRGSALWIRTQALKIYRVNFEICMARREFFDGGEVLKIHY